MLYRDIVLLNNALDNLVVKLRKKLRKELNIDYSDHLEVYTSSDCLVYDFTNKAAIGYCADPDADYYIAYNPFNKRKLLLNTIDLRLMDNNIISITELEYLIGNLLTGNNVKDFDLQKNIYININILKGELLQFFSKFNQIEHNFTDETYFETLYMLYKTLENNLPKDKLFFYFIVDDDYELLTKNSKLLPFSTITISTNYNLFLELPYIKEFIWESLNSVNFEYLKPLFIADNITNLEDEYHAILEYNIDIVFDNEIITDLIGVSILDRSMMNYV